MKNIGILALAAVIAFCLVQAAEPVRKCRFGCTVSIEDIKLQSIQQFVSATGTVRATAEVVLNSEMTGNYFLQNNPGLSR